MSTQAPSSVPRMYKRALLVPLLTLFATAAAAQTGETGLAKCERPAAPFVPSGGYANAQAMQEAGVELKAYFDGINAYLRCVRGEYNRARAEAEQIQLQWRDARDRFQSR